MSWTCPKCGLLVGCSNTDQPWPKTGVLYTCPVCGLELTFDETLKRMTVVSETAPDNPKPSSKR